VQESGAFSVILKLDVSDKNLQPLEYANLIEGGAVQIKKIDQTKWNILSKDFKKGKEDVVTVNFKNLEQNTHYDVRAIVYEKGRAFTEEQGAKIRSFKTKECTKIGKLILIVIIFLKNLFISNGKYTFGNK